MLVFVILQAVIINHSAVRSGVSFLGVPAGHPISLYFPQKSSLSAAIHLRFKHLVYKQQNLRIEPFYNRQQLNLNFEYFSILEDKNSYGNSPHTELNFISWALIPP